MRSRAFFMSLVVLLGGDSMSPGSLTAGDVPGSWTWQPRADSITVERVENEAPRGGGASLRVWGKIDSGWNYIASNRSPVAPGKLYHLSIRLRVDRLGPGTPWPYVKCEFVPDRPGRPLVQIHTDPYDCSRLGQWQELTAEFRVPDGAPSCWLALEKGTSAPTEIDARIGAVRLEPIPRLTALERYQLKSLPASLEAVRRSHPRLHLTGRRIADLRAAITGSHATIWNKVRAQADRAVRRGPPSYVKNDGHSGDEQLWQREVGNTLPLLAMAYVLSGERVYLEGTRRWALASCGYPTWGLGRIDGMDLATGHQLYGLALVYDWCYHDLDDAARGAIRRTLVERASAMYQAAATGAVGGADRISRITSGSTPRAWPPPGSPCSTRWTTRPAGSACPWRPADIRWPRSGPMAPATRASATGNTGSSTCSSSWSCPGRCWGRTSPRTTGGGTRLATPST